MPTARELFRQEIDRIVGNDTDYTVTYAGLDDPDTADALALFAKALDPERERPRLRKPRKDGSIVDVTPSINTGTSYLRNLRLTYQRGFDLLGGSAEAYNEFMLDMVDGRLDDYNGSIERTTAGGYQSAARAFYRFLDEPGQSDDRPDARIEWPAEAINVFSDRAKPRYDTGDMFEESEVDALREGCLKNHNPRRDRALVELLCGTVQRIEAIRTLRIGDVHVDNRDGPPYILLNPEIDGHGDKGAIQNTGRYKPIVSDIGPVREFIRDHPLDDPDVRADHGCPDDLMDCYLLVGDPDHHRTDASRPWDAAGMRDMLDRLGTRVGVDKPVKPHNFRHYAYTKSKDLPIDEDIRRAVFGWRPGSDTGQTTYGHVENRKHGEAFAEAWAEAFGDAGSVPDAIDSTATEQLRALTEVMANSDEPAIRAVAAEVTEDVLGGAHDSS